MTGRSLSTVHEFRVRCPQAERVYLLLRLYDRYSQVLPMAPCGEGAWHWSLRMPLPPGDHGYRYYAYEGGRLLMCIPSDCGSWGEGVDAPDCAGRDQAGAVPVGEQQGSKVSIGGGSDRGSGHRLSFFMRGLADASGTAHRSHEPRDYFGFSRRSPRIW